MGSDGTIRLAVFLGLFAALATAEALAPRRARVLPRAGRWLTNWGLLVIGTGLGRALGFVAIPLAEVAAAADAAARGWGLLNAVTLPFWAEVAVAIVLLDLAIWAQHRLMHAVPALWRLHRVHHADRDFDVTTAIRFHPLELALSLAIKGAVIYALGPPVAAVLLFAVILNGMAMFSHANLALPAGADRLLRLVFVTPDMHRVHHSVERAEHDRNFGFNLSVWDRLFGTYLAAPRGGQAGMSVGLREVQDSRPARLLWSLRFPFRA